MRPLWAVLLLWLGLLTACHDGSDPPPQQVSACSATATGSSMQPGGPLSTPPNGASEQTLQTYLRPGKMEEIGLMQLVNTSKSPIVIDQVVPMPDKRGPLLAFGGAFADTKDTILTDDRSGTVYRDLTPLAGYCLSPKQKPVFVVRVGPASPTQQDGGKRSQVNNFTVAYHTATGRRYFAVFAFRIIYPLHQ